VDRPLLDGNFFGHRSVIAAVLPFEGNDFRYFSMSTPRPHYAVVTIWEHIAPVDRGIRYAEPLYEALGEDDISIVGEGSAFTKELGIEYVNLELELADLSLIPTIIETLEKRGAPKGSELKFSNLDKETLVEFGTSECLALFLDGVNLPDEVYQSTDIDELVVKLRDSSEGFAEYRASWAGDYETSIHFFCDDADAMFQRMEPVISTYPLCRNCRVVIRRGNPKLKPIEIRIPMN
jgi:hypothetical protein